MPGSRDPRQTKAALRGLDGGRQLRGALDELGDLVDDRERLSLFSAGLYGEESPAA